MRLLCALLTILLAACVRDDAPAANDVSIDVDTSLAPAAQPTAAACANRVNNSSAKLRECVTLEGVRAHQAALQAIADANGGTRAAGMPGYHASALYVADKMTKAGYDVTLHAFAFLYAPPSILEQISPFGVTHPNARFVGSGAGNVTAAVTPVDINLTLPRTNTSGCEAADFAGFPAGSIALVQRGTCYFADKVANAQAAGASAVIVFNQGDIPSREGVVFGTLEDFTASIPVVGTTFDAGFALAQPGTTAHVEVLPAESVTEHNVIAESRTGDPNNVVMVGSHLDSPQTGPGIQDSGSGSAAVLETAIQIAKVKPNNRVRFAWWSGGESSAAGSKAYLASLSAAERARIALYLDVDGIAAPNHVFFVYDGDDSDGIGNPAGPAGSGAIEQVFADYYAARALPFKGVDLGSGADGAVFLAAQIPVGGITTGSLDIKSAAEAAVWGCVAGSAYDPCANLACDTFANVSLSALDVNADAVAHATLHFAMSTASVNGR